MVSYETSPPTRGSADHRRQLKVARSHAFPISIPPPPPPPPPPCITKPRFRFVSVGRVCTDCSDRSHPSHIGFVAGNRIHVHLCCYYRAIGVFVYWLTKSTDIESDNRHYFCPVPDPFSNPTPPLPSPHSVAPSLCPAPAHVTPPTEPPDPPNIAAGRVKRVRERNHHRCVHWYTTPTESRRYVSTHGCARCAGKAGELRCTTPSVHSDRAQSAPTEGPGCFLPWIRACPNSQNACTHVCIRVCEMVCCLIIV